METSLASAPSRSPAAPAPTPNRGWSVAFAGMGINLALGVLYSWSVVSKSIPAQWGWSEADKSWPYSVACLVFSLVMVPAGRLQDQFGPRLVASIGGFLVGAGMILAGYSASTLGYVAGFGVLAGAGFGFGYASTTPPAVKWFPAERTGMVAGLVVSGFGLASVYVAPLAQRLIAARGVPWTMRTLGAGFLLVVVALAGFLKVPPAGYAPGGARGAADVAARKADYAPGEMLATRQFYLLWFMYACGAGAGLMIIGKLAKMVQAQAGLSLGFLLVAVLAVGNGAGRVVAGAVSDRFGRKRTLAICFVAQAALMLVLSLAKSGTALGAAPVLALLSALIGANYGANLALFPALTKDYYGLRNFGANYGLVFTAWGVGGFLLPLLAGRLYDATKTFTYAYYVAAAFLAAAALATAALRPPEPR